MAADKLFTDDIIVPDDRHEATAQLIFAYGRLDYLLGKVSRAVRFRKVEHREIYRAGWMHEARR